MRTVVRYSEAFKLEVVRGLESGRFSGPKAAGRAYGVKGAETVAKWVRRYGKNHLLGKVVVVMKADEQAEVKELRQQVRKLEHELSQAVLNSRLESAYLKLACKAAGIEDVEGFKKKHAGAR